jgi:hypothetical protein
MPVAPGILCCPGKDECRVRTRPTWMWEGTTPWMEEVVPRLRLTGM